MEMSWQQGLTEIDTFFDTESYVQNGKTEHVSEQTVASSGGDGAGEAKAVDEDVREQLQNTVQSASGDQPTANANPKQMNKKLFEQLETHVHGSHPENTSLPIPDAHAEHVEVDLVTPPPPAQKDATESGHPDQPHFTGIAVPESEEKEHAKLEATQEVTAPPKTTRQRNDSMNIAFIINEEEEESQQPLIETENLERSPEDRKHTITSAMTSSPPGSTSSTSLPLRPPTTETPSKSPEQPTVVEANLTSNKQLLEMQPPSSDGRSLLMDEMRREDDHACPRVSKSSVDVADQESARDGDVDETDDGESLADALSSPVGLQERLREAAEGPDDDDDVNDDGVDDDELAGDESDVEDAASGSTEKDVVPGEPKLDAVMATREENIELRDVIAVAGQIDPVAGSKKGDGARNKPPARPSRPQTRTRGIQTADATDVMEEATKPEREWAAQKSYFDADAEVGNGMLQQQGPTAAQGDMSGFELASSSPRTLPRKRKTSIENGLAAATGARGAKKAKIATSTNAAEADARATVPDPETNNTVAPPAQAALVTARDYATVPNPMKRKPTKAALNAAKRPKEAVTTKDSSAVGALELKSISGTILSADAKITGDGGRGGAGRRKTRAQIEAEKKAMPNAREAVRARRRGA